MADVTLRFAQALDHVRSEPQIAQLWVVMKGFAERLGYTHLAGVDAARIAGGAVDAMIYSDAPALLERADRTYKFATMPFVARTLSSPETFLISELRNDPKLRGPWTELMSDVVKRGDGLVVPVYDGAEPAAGFIFGGEKPDTSAIARAMLQVLAHAAFARYRALKHTKRPFTPHALTVREIQCLRAAASGRNDAQVGADLGISSRTVRFHMDGAKGKLKAATRVQAIAKALQEKIISVS
jgi:DNA-binding CsgD family transcriptional regulator